MDEAYCYKIDNYESDAKFLAAIGASGRYDSTRSVVQNLLYSMWLREQVKKEIEDFRNNS